VNKIYQKPAIVDRDRLPRQMFYLFTPASLQLLLEATDFDWQYLYDCYNNGDLPNAEIEPADWLEAVVIEWPGLWKAELCRIKHDIPSTPGWIAYCGLCTEYANPRKRARAAALGPELPGMEGMGSYTLHPPCSNRALTWIRKTLTRWSQRAVVIRKPGSIILDSRQARGWDFGTRVYHSEEEYA